MALPPHFVASVRLLRYRFLDEAAEVRQAGVGSARAAGLDRRRVGVQANDADAAFRRFVGRVHFEKKMYVKKKKTNLKKKVSPTNKPKMMYVL